MQIQIQLNVMADYFQIYIKDEAADADFSAAWTQEALDNLIGFDPTTPSAFALGTARNMVVPVDVEIAERSPTNEELDIWDHINECSLRISSGVLIVMGCTDYRPTAPRIHLDAGDYRVRIFYSGLNTVSKDGLKGNDHYRIVLWRDTLSSWKVLKARQR